MAQKQAFTLVEDRQPVFLASAEDIALLNLIQYQIQGSHADDLWNDILGIFKVQAQTLNPNYLDSTPRPRIYLF